MKTLRARLTSCTFTVLLLASLAAVHAADTLKTEASVALEITFDAAKTHPQPFLKVVLDVVFAGPAGVRITVPAFWAGGNKWKVRYSFPVAGTHRYRTRCSDTGDAGLHALEGRVEVTPYTGDNPLYRHGMLQIAPDHRHFEHADGTPLFWLGDTW